MRSTKKKAVVSNKTHTIYACGKIWDKDSLKRYREYQSEFLANRYRQFIIRMSKLTDAGIIEFMESQDNLTGYIRELIQKDMDAKGFQMSEEARRKVELATIGDNISKEDAKALDAAIEKLDEEESDD